MFVYNPNGIVYLLIVVVAVVVTVVLLWGALMLLFRGKAISIAWKRGVWTVLGVLALLAGLVQYGPFIGRAFGFEYPLSIPNALLRLETGNARIVPLTSDAVKLVGSRGPTERELTVFLAERGWSYLDKNDGQISYRKGDAVLSVRSRFRRGYWWYDLDRAP